jgi:hypothetical protein
MKKILFFVFLTSCISQNSVNNSQKLSREFNNDLSFDNFKKLLIEYTKITPYPNINE